MDPVSASFFESIFTLLNSIIDLSYVVTIVPATFVIIKVIDEINKEKVVPLIIKLLVLTLVGLLIGYIWFLNGVTLRVLITSFFFASFSYENLIKFLLDKYKFGYRRTR